MKSKRELLSRCAARTGITSLLERIPARPGLLVINYHRIGDPSACTTYDSAVFSATGDEFDEQLAYLKKNFSIVGLDEAIELAEQPRTLRKFCILITFDDGYRDNFEVAFPILTAHGLPATFFLTTSYLDTRELPWWEQIAGIIQRSRTKVVHLSSGGGITVVVQGRKRAEVIRDIVSAYKQSDRRSPADYVAELAIECAVPITEIPEAPLFMNWQQAKRLADAGMGIGSHTHTHKLLSRLPLAEQVEELSRAKSLLSEKVGVDVEALSYPVGSATAFNQDSVQAAQRTGHRVAFSFYGGVNTPLSTNRFDLRRIGVDLHDTIDLFRMRATLAASASLAHACSGWRTWIP